MSHYYVTLSLLKPEDSISYPAGAGGQWQDLRVEEAWTAQPGPLAVLRAAMQACLTPGQGQLWMQPHPKSN